jgi:hypothetical protein
MWERAVKQLRDPRTPHFQEICPYDKVLMTRDMSKFLLKIVSDLPTYLPLL